MLEQTKCMHATPVDRPETGKKKKHWKEKKAFAFISIGSSTNENIKTIFVYYTVKKKRR
jgi:hypothetical protein